MVFESMKNEYYQQQDSNSSDSSNPSSGLRSNQQSSFVPRTNSVQSSDSDNYVILSVEVCQVKRKVRKLGEKDDLFTKDRKLREMFRNLFKDLWGIFGTY